MANQRQSQVLDLILLSSSILENFIIKPTVPDRTFGKAFHPKGIDDIFFYTSSDIYVMPHTDLDPLRSPFFKTLVDEAGTPNTVVSWGGSGLFEDQFVGSTQTLGPGSYDIVYDECQEEKLDFEDALFSNALTIQWIKELPVICKGRCVSVNAPVTLEQVKSTFLKWSIFFESISISLRGYNTFKILDSVLDVKKTNELTKKIVAVIAGIKRTIGYFVSIGFSLNSIRQISDVPDILNDKSTSGILGVAKLYRDKFRGLAADLS